MMNQNTSLRTLRCLFAAALPFAFAASPLSAQKVGGTTQVNADSSTVSVSKQAASETETPDYANMAPQAVLEQIFSQQTDSVQGMVDIIEEAEKAGANEQVALEARLILALRTETWELFDAVLPRMQEMQDEWNYENSAIIGSEEGYEGILLMMQARQALEAGEGEKFEKLVKKAFWIDPSAAQIIAPWITEYRQMQAMSEITLPMDRELKNAAGETVTLAQLVEGKKALLIDFWASWCNPCMRLMPELKGKAEALIPQDVVVAGMNTESSVKIAADIKKQQEIGFTWLVEPEDRGFSSMLMIDSIPRMILVSPEGRVLFNGHPMDTERLAAALEKVGAKL